MGTMARTELMKQLLSSLYLRYMKNKKKVFKILYFKSRFNNTHMEKLAPY